MHMDYAVMWQSVTILFFVQYLYRLKICMVNNQISFIFSMLGNMFHCIYTPLIAKNFMESCGIQDQNLVSHLLKKLSIFTLQQHKFSQNFSSGPFIFSHNGNYRMLSLYGHCFVLVYCQVSTSYAAMITTDSS